MLYQYLPHGPLLEFTCPDSQQEHVDDVCIQDVDDYPDSQERYYIRQFYDSPVSKHWRERLGQDLAVKFLLKLNKVGYIFGQVSQRL